MNLSFETKNQNGCLDQLTESLISQLVKMCEADLMLQKKGGGRLENYFD